MQMEADWIIDNDLLATGDVCLFERHFERFHQNK